MNELRASGAETMLRSAARQWHVHGVEAEILAIAAAPGPYADALRAAAYRVHHVPDVPLWSVPWRLMRQVSAGRYDVVHLHAERGSFWFALAARLGGATVVRTVHSCFAFRGILALERTVQRALLRATGAVAHIAVGPMVAENERRRFRNRAEVVENWVAPEFVPPDPAGRARARTALGIDDGRPVLISVGNCAPVKRHETVLAALAHPLCPTDVYYLHVGDEEESGEERELAARLGVADRVRFLGRADPLPMLHASDLFVMPSAYEGLSIAAVEALATGLPAVLADAPGLRDFAWASPAVTLTDPGPAALAAAITSALQSGAADRDASALIHDRYGMERGVAQYASCYRNLMGRK
ncbi:glycosyltransferase [Streptomyces violascens]|uniref:glycosyltransferase n=1 Tax=Streptomyces violascens TaxID=67381 RepID=UPI0036C0B0DB